MSKDINESTGRQNFEWIQGDSGTSYLCPKGSVDKDSASEDELKAACVDESNNPHND